MEDNEVIYRKFDSDDVIRLRSKCLVTDVVDDKEKVSIDSGMLQKASIILGVKQCPWFSDIVDESKGITDPIFNKRWSIEFRKIPVENVDKIFRESQNFNKVDYDINELKKK